MGDRCYCTIEVAPPDRSRVEQIGYRVAEFGAPTVPGCLFLEEEEASYGNYDALRQLLAEHVPFIAYNGEGGEYGARMTVSDGSELAECSLLSQGSGRPAVEVDEDGIDRAQLDAALNYLCVLRRAKATLATRSAAVAEARTGLIPHDSIDRKADQFTGRRTQ